MLSFISILNHLDKHNFSYPCVLGNLKYQYIIEGLIINNIHKLIWKQLRCYLQHDVSRKSTYLLFKI